MAKFSLSTAHRRVSEIQFTVRFFRDGRTSRGGVRRLICGRPERVSVAGVDPLFLGWDRQARCAPARDHPCTDAPP